MSRICLAKTVTILFSTKILDCYEMAVSPGQFAFDLVTCQDGANLVVYVEADLLTEAMAEAVWAYFARLKACEFASPGTMPSQSPMFRCFPL
jgi:hypothetical protein